MVVGEGTASESRNAQGAARLAPGATCTSAGNETTRVGGVGTGGGVGGGVGEGGGGGVGVGVGGTLARTASCPCQRRPTKTPARPGAPGSQGASRPRGMISTTTTTTAKRKLTWCESFHLGHAQTPRDRGVPMAEPAGGMQCSFPHSSSTRAPKGAHRQNHWLIPKTVVQLIQTPHSTQSHSCRFGRRLSSPCFTRNTQTMEMLIYNVSGQMFGQEVSWVLSPQNFQQIIKQA
jgi:hypothetical protein